MVTDEYKLFNLFQRDVAFHIETSHLFCFVKQKIGFYMKCNAGVKWVANLAALVCLSTYDLFLPPDVKGLNLENVQ